MIEFEITNEMIERAEERMYQMERSAKVAFEELFPNLDFEKDFLANESFSDINYLFETVEKVEEGRDDPGFVALYKLLLWTLEGQMHELIREQAIETIMNFDDNEVNEFITWLQEKGLPYEEVHNAECQIEMLSAFLNERKSIISYIDCPKCGAEKSIKDVKCTIPGYGCLWYKPCGICGHDPYSSSKSC